MIATPLPDLDRLAAQHRSLLKDEPAARVELLGLAAEAVVRKTYRNRGLRWLQTFARRCRAEREFANLSAIAAAGLPGTQPIQWSERRRFGFVDSSTIVTSHVPAAKSLKLVLAEGTTAESRRRLAVSLGHLLERVHRVGVLWCTPMPRNVLVVGDGGTPQLLLCDLPAAVRFGGPVPHWATLLDLYEAVGSPSRRRDWSPAERWRCLLAYAAGNRRLARTLWRQLARRSRIGHRARKNLLMALRTYILPAPSPPARGMPAR